MFISLFLISIDFCFVLFLLTLLPNVLHAFIIVCSPPPLSISALAECPVCHRLM